MNPFLTKGYISSEFFCDREVESTTILKNIQANQDITLISPRKMGKTGLIHHVFQIIKSQNLPYETLYADIYATLNLDDLIKTLSEVIIQKFPAECPIGTKFFNLIKSLRPVISYDALSGAPQISFNFVSSEEKQITIKSLFEFLNSQDVEIVFAIDEFQQIAEYPEKNIEALLRSVTQNMHNIHFIYCGSNRRMMTQMFQTAGRPFFSSTRTMSIEEINADKYSEFIQNKFAPASISIDAVQYILDWSHRHTFYTQAICNAVYELGLQKITIDDVKKAVAEILEMESATFFQIRELLPTQQWLMLIAIAKEGFVNSVGTQSFISKHNLGSITNARRSLEALVEKDLVLSISTKDDTRYRIYNVFFEHWLKGNC